MPFTYFIFKLFHYAMDFWYFGLQVDFFEFEESLHHFSLLRELMEEKYEEQKVNNGPKSDDTNSRSRCCLNMSNGFPPIFSGLLTILLISLNYFIEIVLKFLCKKHVEFWISDIDNTVKGWRNLYIEHVVLVLRNRVSISSDVGEIVLEESGLVIEQSGIVELRNVRSIRIKYRLCIDHERSISFFYLFALFFHHFLSSIKTSDIIDN